MSYLRLASFLIISLVSFSGLAVSPDTSPWKAQLDKAGLQQMSVRFVRLSDGKPLISVSDSATLSPASTMKLVTGAAALSTFTPEFSFETRFFVTGQRKGSVIEGDLIIVGDGDPFIVSEKLWQLAADFSHMGIQQIRGDIIIDNSLFAGNGRDESRRGGSLSSSNAYDAPVSAFGVNFNTLAVAVAPNGSKGSLALTSLDPYQIRGVSLDNKVRTTIGSGSTIKATRVTKKQGTTLFLQGSIGSGEDLTKLYRSVSSHAEMSGEQIRAFLAGRGITISGAVKEGRLTGKSKHIYTLQSYPMAKIIEGLNKFSNNYIADVLTKRLGAERPIKGSPRAPGSGSFENGLAVVGDFLSKQVKTVSGYKIFNGSGLDTGNRLSARHLTDVLAYAANHMEIFPEFLASLPASGWDGTLKDRFDAPGTSILSGKVRAKTGTLTQPVSVSSLAGYVRHPVHGMVAFAILQNGVAGKPQPAIDRLRQSQDALLASFMNSK